MTMFIYRGLPGSGKTYLARDMQEQYHGALVGRDHIRKLFFGKEGVLTHTEEQRVTEIQDHLIRTSIQAGQDVYVDDMNLRSRYVRRLMQIANSMGEAWEIIDLTDTSLEHCIANDLNRERTVGEYVLRDLYMRFIHKKGYPLEVPSLPQEQETYGMPYIPPLNKPRAIMIDLDGTLCIKGDRDIYDGSKCEVDTVDEAVLETVLAMEDAGFNIIFCSGRSDEWRAETERWLLKHTSYVPGEDCELFMRSKDDKRADWKVKLDLFDKHIRYDYNVLYVLDDRKQVVDAWRSIGLKVFQVEPGEF